MIKSKHWLFRLRGGLRPQQALILSIIGMGLFLLMWIILTYGSTPFLKPSQLPSPMKVLRSYNDLLADNDLIVNTTKSIGLNVSGYILALLISIPLGFVIGLIPLFKGLFQRFITAFRFVPLTATIAIFIAWFGIGITMKSSFMAFGIIIFLLPIVVQRIEEVKDVYLKTVYTLGATDWQTVVTVYMPSVMSKLWDDIRILTAISWTYIIFVEAINSQGGLGDIIIYGARRQGRFDKVFALLILIIAIGIFQDRLFAYLDRKLFPHKYQNIDKYNNQIIEKSPLEVIIDYSWQVFFWIILALYIGFSLDEMFGIFGNIRLLEYLFGDTKWVVHFIFLSTIFYKIQNSLRKD